MYWLTRADLERLNVVTDRTAVAEADWELRETGGALSLRVAQLRDDGRTANYVIRCGDASSYLFAWSMELEGGDPAMAKTVSEAISGFEFLTGEEVISPQFETQSVAKGRTVIAGAYVPRRLFGALATAVEPASISLAMPRVAIAYVGGWGQPFPRSNLARLLPMISPLAVVVTFLIIEGRFAVGDDPRAGLRDDLGDTALLSPSNPLLAALIERDGLNEMHMHLNGTTETDILWADAVRYPREYHDELLEAQSKAQGLTSELYDQIELGLTPYEIFRRLRAARRVRHTMAEAIGQPQAGGGQPLSVARLLTLMNVELDDREASFAPTAAASAPPVTAIWPDVTTALIDEAAFLLVCLTAASRAGPLQEVMGLGLYFNLLAHTLVGRISMQQIDEIGFDQFQKYTAIGVRERLERGYEERFSQLNIAPPHRVLTHLEGRLAPKNTVEDLASLVNSITQGWLRFRGCPRLGAARGLQGSAPPCMTGDCRGGACAGGPSAGRPNSELSLVIHFIKRELPPPRGRTPECRDGPLRADLARQAEVVRALRQRHPFGEIRHKGLRHVGDHEAIVERELWEAVQLALDGNRRQRERAGPKDARAMLRGLVRDSAGIAMAIKETGKPNGRHYRYYVGAPREGADGTSVKVSTARLDALVERAVVERMTPAAAQAYRAATAINRKRRLRAIVRGVEVASDAVALTIDTRRLNANDTAAPPQRGRPRKSDPSPFQRFVLPVNLGAVAANAQLLPPDAAMPDAEHAPDRALVAAIAEAHRWRWRLEAGQVSSLNDLAAAAGMDVAVFEQRLSLAYLAPDIISDIVRGRQSAAVSLETLFAGQLPQSWKLQNSAFASG